MAGEKRRELGGRRKGGKGEGENRGERNKRVKENKWNRTEDEIKESKAMKYETVGREMGE